MTKTQKDVREIMKLLGEDIPISPISLNKNERVYQIKILLEKILEFSKSSSVLIFDKACGHNLYNIDHFDFSCFDEVDLTKISGALGNLLHAVERTASSFGIDLEPVLDILQEKNHEINGFSKLENLPNERIQSELVLQSKINK